QCALCQQQIERLLNQTDLPVVGHPHQEAAPQATVADVSHLHDAPPNSEPAVEATPLPHLPGYEGLEKVGRGAMGVVYRARHLALTRLVPRRWRLAAAQREGEARRRFRAEAEAVARLQHPHIVPIYEVNESDGLAYLALEFCAGGSLAEQLDGTPWPAERAA